MEQKNTSGTLFRYTGKKDAKASSPDYRGTATINGKKLSMAAWVNKSKAGQNYLRIYFFDVAKDSNPTGVIEQPQAGLPAEQSRLEMGTGNIDSVMIDDLPF